MLRKTLWLLLLCIWMQGAVAANDGVVVITHSDTPIDSLSRKQVKNIYLGAPLAFDVTSYVLPTEQRLSQKFTTRVIGLSAARLRSYIAQMRFSGRPIKLVEVTSEQDMIAQILATPGAIGYVSASTPLPDNIRIVYASDS